MTKLHAVRAHIRRAPLDPDAPAKAAMTAALVSEDDITDRWLVAALDRALAAQVAVDRDLKRRG